MNIEQKNIENDEMSFKDLIINFKEWFFYLKSRWKSIFIAGVFGGSIALAITFFVKPTYKATLTFAMEEDKSSGGGLSGALGIASSIGIDLGGANGGGAFASSNLAELMKSRLIVEKALLSPIIIDGKSITLLDYYIQFSGLRKKWEGNSILKNLNFSNNRNLFTFQQDSILLQIYKKLTDKNNLNVSQKDKKVTILNIDVLSENEIFSKIFCENIAKETSDFYIKTKSKKARINVDVLQKQVDSVRNELNGAISNVASETDNVYNLNPAYNLKAAKSKKKQIDVQANTAILTNLVIQLELAKITLRKETPLIQLIDSPILPLEKEKLGKVTSVIIGFFLCIIGKIIILLFGQIYKNLMI